MRFERSDLLLEMIEKLFAWGNCFRAILSIVTRHRTGLGIGPNWAEPDRTMLKWAELGPAQKCVETGQPGPTSAHYWFISLTSFAPLTGADLLTMYTGRVEALREP